MTPVLELKDLHVTLRQHRRATELVKGVSFAVGARRVPGYPGESGSGKVHVHEGGHGPAGQGLFRVRHGNVSGRGPAGEERGGAAPSAGRPGGYRAAKSHDLLRSLYRVGDQIAESFAAHNSWSGEEIRRRSLELLEKKCASAARRRCWRSTPTSSPAGCSSGS